MKSEFLHYSLEFMTCALKVAGLDDDDALALARILDQLDFHLKEQVGSLIIFFAKGYRGGNFK